MQTLPEGATEASRWRYRLASELAESRLPSIAEEVALGGSVALGVADETSDIDLYFWIASLPSADQQEGWLADIGATDATLAPEPWDGVLLVSFRYRGVWVEANWQTWAALDERLRAILAGEVTGHAHLLPAWMVANAVPLTPSRHIAAWQDRLGHYPDRLQQRLIEVNTRVWQLPYAMTGRWAYCPRGQSLALTERLLWDTYNVLRVLFALNRQWEPDWKWLRLVTGRLTLAPQRLVERLDTVFLAPRPEERVQADLELILDTLALLPPSPGIARAQAVVQGALRSRR